MASSTTDSSIACITCAIYRPDSDPRLPHRPPVCDGDRALLDRHLVEVANLVADLSNPEQPLVDRRQYERFDRNGDSLGQAWADPTAPFDGVAPINSRSKQPSVSGSRERPIPIRVAELDLKAPARVPNATPASRDWPEDQIGNLSAASVLDSWVRDTRDTLWPGNHLPKATVDELVSWLRYRLDDICDQHPAVDEFAGEIRDLRSALRSAAGVTEPPPERCDGIACKRCDMAMLYRQPDGDVHCLNPNCLAVYRPDEYQDWVKTLAAETKIKRHADQNA